MGEYNDIKEEYRSDVQQIYLRCRMSHPEILMLEGERPSHDDFDKLITTPVDAYDEDTGRLIFRFRKRVILPSAVELAKSVFGDIDIRLKPSYDRKSAAGRIDLERVRKVRPDVVAIEAGADKFTGRFILKSGRKLNNIMSNPVSSYIAGYNYNRYRKLGTPAKFSAMFPGEWEKSIPFFDSVGDCFDNIMLDESKHMREWCSANGVLPNFTIGRTCLSTVAINVNYESCYHFDRGDLKTGYSTLTAIATGGHYRGGELVLPHYRVAIDINERDLLCNQSHIDLHGNMAVTPLPSGAKRISFVTYLKHLLRHAKNKSGSSAAVKE